MKSTQSKLDSAKRYYYEHLEHCRIRNRNWILAHRPPCPECGKPMTIGAKFCQKCYMPKTRGKNHPSWRGGRHPAVNGRYIVIMMREHPRANRDGYVLEHIVVWEQTHGKPLPDGWVIHHLNGIGKDNRPSNLVGLPSKKHYLLLEAKGKRIQELEALLNNQYQLL